MLSEEEADDLIYCSRSGELDELKTLVENIIEKHDQGNRSTSTFNQLMRKVAESNAANNTLLHFASANGHLGMWSLDFSDIAFILAEFETYFCLDIVTYLNIDSTLETLLAQNDSGNTPLHWASLNGHLEVVQALVKRIEELTPSASVKDLSHLTEEERDAEEEKEARKRSVWDVVNLSGKGPMSEAQMNNQDKVVSFLLQHMIAGLGESG